MLLLVSFLCFRQGVVTFYQLVKLNAARMIRLLNLSVDAPWHILFLFYPHFNYQSSDKLDSKAENNLLFCVFLEQGLF